jgi:nucleoside-diphosphate-sugar epimerase
MKNYIGNKKVIIIGHNGYIGSSIYFSFIKQNYEVFFTNKIGKNNDILINNRLNINEISDSKFNVLWLAHSPQRDCISQDIIFEKNVLPIKNLLNKIKIENIDRFIYISTNQVYDGTYKQKYAVENPQNYYGLSHLINEKLIIDKFKKTDKAKILRLTNIYGVNNGTNPSKINNSFLNLFVQELSINKKFSLNTDGKQKRDWVSISQLVTLITNIIINKESFGNIIDVRSKGIYSLKQLVTIINKDLFMNYPTVTFEKNKDNRAFINFSKNKCYIFNESKSYILKELKRLI